MRSAILDEKDREGPGETVRDREAYRLHAGVELKLGGMEVGDMRGLEPELPLSPSLRLPVPPMRKRAGKRPRRLRPLSPAVLGEKDREARGKKIGQGEPIEGMHGL